MMRFVGVTWLAICLAACDTPAEGQEEVLCTTVCRCSGDLPSLQDACVQQCVGDGAFTQASEQCVECIYVHGATCSDLLDACTSSCSAPQPSP